VVLFYAYTPRAEPSRVVVALKTFFRAHASDCVGRVLVARAGVNGAASARTSSGALETSIRTLEGEIAGARDVPYARSVATEQVFYDARVEVVDERWGRMVACEGTSEQGCAGVRELGGEDD
jgi:predicted sulfurtransferase